MTKKNLVPMVVMNLRLPEELKVLFHLDCVRRKVTMRERLIELIADSLPARHQVEDKGSEC